MNAAEWESLCDGCGQCCVLRLVDDDTGDILTTDMACKLLDRRACRCSRYAERQTLVPDCLKLDARLARTLEWLPPTCAYRLVAEGEDLFDWHPLKSGDPESVHRAGVSVRGKLISEADVDEADWWEHVIAWPKD